jgi:uncharacterized lipoprotein YmbA
MEEPYASVEQQETSFADMIAAQKAVLARLDKRMA